MVRKVSPRSVQDQPHLSKVSKFSPRSTRSFKVIPRLFQINPMSFVNPWSFQVIPVHYRSIQGHSRSIWVNLRLFQVIKGHYRDIPWLFQEGQSKIGSFGQRSTRSVKSLQGKSKVCKVSQK